MMDWQDYPYGAIKAGLRATWGRAFAVALAAATGLLLVWLPYPWEWGAWTTPGTVLGAVFFGLPALLMAAVIAPGGGLGGVACVVLVVAGLLLFCFASHHALEMWVALCLLCGMLFAQCGIGEAWIWDGDCSAARSRWNAGVLVAVYLFVRFRPLLSRWWRERGARRSI